MGGSGAKKRRKALRARPALAANAELVARSADAVLTVQLHDFAVRSRTAQVVVGLCRAAFAQSKVIALIASADMLAAAAPNRRLVLEVALRLHWLNGLPRPERLKAVDTMLEKDRQDTNRILAHLRDASHVPDFDPTEMNAFVLDNETRGPIHQQATRLKSAVDASEVKPWSTFAMWLEETQFAHASGNLAGSYAPMHDEGHMIAGKPDPMDESLEAHRLIQIQIVTTTGHLLISEGLPEAQAGRIAAAFFSIRPI